MKYNIILLIIHLIITLKHFSFAIRTKWKIYLGREIFPKVNATKAL